MVLFAKSGYLYLYPLTHLFQGRCCGLSKPSRTRTAHIEALCTIIRTWKQPNVHQWMNEQTNCGLSIQWNVIQSSKGMKYSFMLTEGSQSQKVLYCMIPFIWNIYAGKTRDRKQSSGFPGDWSRGNGVWLLQGVEFLLGVIKTFWG